MIQGHTLDALLAEPLRRGLAFEAWTFVRGLTSTTFLLTAGMAFALAHSAPRASAQNRLRRSKRALKLVGLGYLMHAPLGILFGQPAEAALTDFLAVDVLQCIGLSLLMMEGLAATIRDGRRLSWISGALAFTCLALGPLSEQLVPAGPARLFFSYLSGQAGSSFPLVPWGGPVFAGLAIGLWIVPLLQLGKVLQAAGRLLAVGAATTTLGLVLLRVGPRMPARVSPAYFGLRLGLVVLLAGLLVALFEGRLRLPRLLLRLASETLFLYVSHVLILYAGLVGLSRWLGRTLPLGSALLVALALLISCSAGALGYRRVAHSLRGRRGGGTPRAQPPLPSG